MDEPNTQSTLFSVTKSFEMIMETLRFSTKIAAPHPIKCPICAMEQTTLMSGHLISLKELRNSKLPRMGVEKSPTQIHLMLKIRSLAFLSVPKTTLRWLTR